MSGSKTVLVTGVTGKQGGSVARALLARGHRVRGLTRDPKSEAAQQAAAEGIEVVPGDFDDPATLVAAATGVDSVFAMTTPFEAGEQAETAQGIALIDAARQAGVSHFVYTSVASADQHTGVPHFESKLRVEEHLRASDVPFTIIAPVYFMENLFFPQSLDGLRNGVLAMPLPPDLPLQQVALADIGAFAAHVLDHREAFLGQRIDIASDELTPAQLAQALGVETLEVPMEQIRAFSEDMALMYEWFISTGYSADIQGLRERYPEVGWHRFEDWAGKEVASRL